MTTEIFEGEDEFNEEEVKKEEIVPEDIKLLKEIRQALSQNLITLGLKTTIKGVKNKEISKIIVAKNIPLQTRNELLHLAKHAQLPLEDFSGDSEILGMECKRSHPVLLLGIKKQ